jgi:uncharacterized HAD superfamily protein
MVIAIDVDDVLADSASAANAWFNATYGTTHQLSDYITPRYDSIWSKSGVSANEAFPEYLKSAQFAALKPLPGCADTLRELSQEHTLHVITSRHDDMLELTHSWIDEHFSGIFESITLTNHNWDPDAVQQLTKLEVCQQLGAEVIVEDNPTFVSEIVAAGIPVIMREMPWNRDLPELTTSDMVFPFSEWGESFEKAFKQLLASRPI